MNYYKYCSKHVQEMTVCELDIWLCIPLEKATYSFLKPLPPYLEYIKTSQPPQAICV